MSTLFHPNQTNVTDEILLEVFLQIKSGSCNELIQHLINNKIGFRLSSFNSIPAKSKPYVSETPELSIINVDDKLHKDIIIQEVYDKYITNGLASLPPLFKKKSQRNGISAYPLSKWASRLCMANLFIRFTWRKKWNTPSNYSNEITELIKYPQWLDIVKNLPPNSTRCSRIFLELLLKSTR